LETVTFESVQANDLLNNACLRVSELEDDGAIVTLIVVAALKFFNFSVQKPCNIKQNRIVCLLIIMPLNRMTKIA
jgi:hypothetical protein